MRGSSVGWMSSGGAPTLRAAMDAVAWRVPVYVAVCTCECGDQYVGSMYQEVCLRVLVQNCSGFSRLPQMNIADCMLL